MDKGGWDADSDCNTKLKNRVVLYGKRIVYSVSLFNTLHEMCQQYAVIGTQDTED